MSRFGRLSFVTFLTLVRIPLVILFFIGALVNSLIGTPSFWLFGVSFACLILAALSDLLDGYFARRLGVTTKFGSCADPLTDKVFYLGTLPLLVFMSARNDHVVHSVILLFLVVTSLLRDQWVSFLRAIGSGTGRVSLGANWSGKLRTGYTFPVICIIFLYEAVKPAFIPLPGLYALEAIAFLMNVVSFYVYTRQYWPQLRDAMTTSE